MNAQKRTRVEKALTALKAQSAAIPPPGQSIKTVRKELRSAQADMVACQPETSEIARFVSSQATKKSIPELTLEDLAPLYS